MAIRKIAIIHSDKYTKETILEDMREEGFKYYFKFINDLELDDDKALYLEASDEVWTFGDVADQYNYDIAIDMGCDIWSMA